MKKHKPSSITMNKDYQSLVPEFIINPRAAGIKYIIFSADIDGYLTALLFSKKHNMPIAGMYDFKGIYVFQEYINIDLKECIFTDADIAQDYYCIGNHVSKIYKEDSINSKCFNLNNIFDIYARSERYFEKYCGSCVLKLIGALNIKLPKSNEARAMLLAIDSTFLGFYSRWENPVKAHRFFVNDVLGYSELIELEENHPQDDFFELVRQYRVNDDIEISEEGYLKTDADFKSIGEILGVNLELSKDRLYCIKELNTISLTLIGSGITTKEELERELDKRIFSIALTAKNYCCASLE